MLSRGRIREEDIAALRERADLVAIAQEHVALKKRGRLFWGRCPFHEEKTPSFKVDPGSQLYHCFGCGEGGNVYTFLMKVERLDFPEAVEALAGRLGYPLRFEAGPRASSGREAWLYQINQLTLEFYHYLLLESEAGKRARNYLAGRGFGREVVEGFKLGYAPGSGQTLLRHLNKKGYGLDELIQAGVVMKGQSGAARDLFRDRIIFPILDMKGRPCAFGGRTLDSPGPKYINSPETPIYRKGSLLYGLHQAKPHLSRGETAVVVEGYTDVIALHRHGVPSAVAALGTALTAQQVTLLRRFAERILLLFDADAAGMAAAERVFGLKEALDLRESSADIRVAALPSGTDPADWVKDGGREGFEAVSQESVPLVHFVIRQVVRKSGATSPAEGIKAARAALKLLVELKFVSLLPGVPAADEEECVRLVACETHLSEAGVFSELNRMRDKGTAANRAWGPRIGRATGGMVSDRALPPPAPKRDEELAQREILVLLIQREEVCELLPYLSDEHFATPNYAAVLGVLKELGSGKKIVDNIHLLPGGLRELVAELALEPVQADDIIEYSTALYHKLKEFEVGRQIASLKSHLQKLNPLREGERYDRLFREVVELEAIRRDLRAVLSGGSG